MEKGEKKLKVVTTSSTQISSLRFSLLHPTYWWMNRIRFFPYLQWALWRYYVCLWWTSEKSCDFPPMLVIVKICYFYHHFLSRILQVWEHSMTKSVFYFMRFFIFNLRERSKLWKMVREHRHSFMDFVYNSLICPQIWVWPGASHLNFCCCSLFIYKA